MGLTDAVIRDLARRSPLHSVMVQFPYQLVIIRNANRTLLKCGRQLFDYPSLAFIGRIETLNDALFMHRLLQVISVNTADTVQFNLHLFQTRKAVYLIGKPSYLLSRLDVIK